MAPRGLWRRSAALAACLVLGCASSDGAAPNPSPRTIVPPAVRPGYPERVLLVSVAGFTPAAYRLAPDMPSVTALAAAGVAADAVTGVAPAARYPAHASLVTGERPATHGIVADHLLGDRGVRAAVQSHASLLKAPTLWDLAGRSGLRVASLDWPTTTGAAIDSLLPDVVVVARGDTWASAVAEAMTPALRERARRAGLDDPVAGREGSARDALLVSLACELLGEERAPDLTLVRLSQAAPVVWREGPDAPAVGAALARADAEIDRLLACLARTGRLEATAVAVVGDAGTLPVHTLVAPNAVLAEAGLLRPTAAGGVLEWRAVSRSNGASAFVYARGDAAAVEARSALVAAAERTRAFHVVSAQEMIALGADPEAWFGLAAEPGFAFGDQSVAPWLQPAAHRGVAGYLPGDAAPPTGFVLWGRGVRAGVRIPRMRQTDIAPTLARLLRLPLERVDGRPLVGVLAVPQEVAPRRAPEPAGGR